MNKIKAFFNGVMKEVGRVRWPKKKDLIKYSFATIMFIVFFGVFFFILDVVFSFIKSLVR
jgi:preprotein translocase subunit SecE